MNASPIDLTSVPLVKSWLSASGKPASPNGADDANIQACITAASRMVLSETGLGPQGAVAATQSPFVQPVQYSETYNGNGKNRLFLRNQPITSVVSLIINGRVIPQSTAFNVSGWVIDSDGKSIWLRSGGNAATFAYTSDQFWFGNIGFAHGVQNVALVYTAGVPTVPVSGELASIPTLPPSWALKTGYAAGALINDGVNIQQALATNGTSGTSTPGWQTLPGAITLDGSTMSWICIGPIATFFSVAVQNIWLSDTGVSFFVGGSALTPVLVAPAAGQYFVQGGGSYLFNSTDAGKQILFSYTASGTPADLEIAIRKLAAQNYKRRSWIDQKSQAMAQNAGTLSYRDWDMEPEVRKCIYRYKRTAMTS